VGGIEGGIDGLRAQLVGMLQGFGAGVVQVLESGSRAVWWTMEGRRKMLEEESPKAEGETQE
jgi:large subunit ribosomal protein L10